MTARVILDILLVGVGFGLLCLWNEEVQKVGWFIYCEGIEGWGYMKRGACLLGGEVSVSLRLLCLWFFFDWLRFAW